MPDKNKKVIFVTGGAGYIGSHVCKALFRKGYTPVTIDNLCSGNKEAVQWGPLEEGDIRDTEKLCALIEEYKPMAIMHFAALIQVGDSVTNPSDFYSNNVTGSYSLLEAARQNNIKNVVFSSTAAVYGMPDVDFLSEDRPLNPINPYGQTKLAMENMIRDYAHAYGLDYAILRYFNAAGADADCETGTAYPRDTHLVPLLMQVAAGQRDEIHIYGTDYDTPDGTAIRDYVHVTDLADAHVKALEHIIADKGSLTLNLGTNHGYSVREVVDFARRFTDPALAAVETPRREGDPAKLVANASAAQELLNWKPQCSDMETIIKTAWAWKQKQLAAR